jgi:COMPASS component SWD1
MVAASRQMENTLSEVSSIAFRVSLCSFCQRRFVFLGADNKASHNIYIWDRDSGGLSKILEGPKDPLEDLDVSSLESLFFYR